MILTKDKIEFVLDRLSNDNEMVLVEAPYFATRGQLHAHFLNDGLQSRYWIRVYGGCLRMHKTEFDSKDVESLLWDSIAERYIITLK